MVRTISRPWSQVRARSLYVAFSARECLLKVKRKGPFSRLFFDVEEVRERSDGPLVARHRNQLWNVDGERFTRLDVEGRAELQFVDGESSERYRPGLCSFVNGIAYCDGEVLAYIDAHRYTWIRRSDGGQWRVLLVEPAP